MRELVWCHEKTKQESLLTRARYEAAHVALASPRWKFVFTILSFWDRTVCRLGY